jgi:glycosyl transferase family 2
MTDASARSLTVERPRPEKRRQLGDAIAIEVAAEASLDDSQEGCEGNGVLVVSTDWSEISTTLVTKGTSVSNLVVSPDDDSDWTNVISESSSFAVCVLDNVLGRSAEPAALLARAYGALRPGGRLIVTLDGADQQSSLLSGWSRFRRQNPPFTGELLPALLFREGFEKPRITNHGGRTVATAFRSLMLPPYQRPQRLSVVMPVFNEQKTFRVALDTLLDKVIPGIEIDIIIVESNSTDGTRDEALKYADHPRVRLILEERPQGKGHAVRVGLQEAKGDFLLIQDADLEYDINDYDSLLEPLRNFENGFVLGMRTSPDGSWGMRQFGERNFVSRIMNLGHVGFLALFNLVYGQHLRDPFTMYKVIRRDCLYGLTFECNRFDFDWELTAKLIRAGYIPKELPASYHSRSFTEGKKVSFIKDPLTWVVACFKYRFARLYN